MECNNKINLNICITNKPKQREKHTQKMEQFMFKNIRQIDEPLRFLQQKRKVNKHYTRNINNLQ